MHISQWLTRDNGVDSSLYINITKHSDNSSYCMWILSTCDPWPLWVFVQYLYGVIVSVYAASGWYFFFDPWSWSRQKYCLNNNNNKYHSLNNIYYWRRNTNILLFCIKYNSSQIQHNNYRIIRDVSKYHTYLASSR